ncbi:uncharacterized protein LOC111261765 [Varroa jacobsoni]|uniref:uncharacterized protein LOC111261765 n=1 Tax=Varroa jacobsoni TaxID=62625 RepID=UPI000BF7BC82|nr:uncharacterized protein LOC111261765 [Varroa jacobsoni]
MRCVSCSSVRHLPLGTGLHALGVENRQLNKLWEFYQFDRTEFDRKGGSVKQLRGWPDVVRKRRALHDFFHRLHRNALSGKKHARKNADDVSVITKPARSLASAAVNSYRLVNLSHSQWFIRVGYKVNMEWNQLHDRHLNFILQLRPYTLKVPRSLQPSNDPPIDAPRGPHCCRGSRYRVSELLRGPCD